MSYNKAINDVYRRRILMDFSGDLSKGKVAVKPFLNPDTVR